MSLRNREGEPVDPVPFLVTVGCTCFVGYSFLPGYFMALGFSVLQAVGLATVGFGLVVAGAYLHLVRYTSPLHRDEVPAGVRFHRLIYVMLLLAALIVLLALPLLVDW